MTSSACHDVRARNRTVHGGTSSLLRACSVDRNFGIADLRTFRNPSTARDHWPVGTRETSGKLAGARIDDTARSTSSIGQYR